MTSKLFRVSGVSNSLWSESLAPVESEDRRADGISLAAMWADGCGLPVYLLAGALIAGGTERGVAVAVIFLGSLAMMAVAVANGHAGVRYGIPFSVAARVSFGVFGAKLAVALRVLVGCGWLGIVCWVGATAVFAMMRMVSPGVPDWGLGACFVVFLVTSAGGSRRRWGIWISPVLLIGVFTAQFALGHGTPPAHPVATPRSILSALTAVTGLWAWSALGAANPARMVKTQRQQLAGSIALPTAAVLFALLAASAARTDVWSPVGLIVDGVRPGMTVVLLAALSAALWSGARIWCAGVVADIAGIAPGSITPALAAALASLVATSCGPWQLLSDPARYVDGWLVGCSGLIAPVAAVMLVEYFALRRRWLNVDDLYQRDGLYEYSHGWNWKALAAVAAAWLAVLCGVWLPALRVLYDGAGFVGFFIAAALYWLLRSGPPDTAQIPPTPLLIPLAVFESEGASG